jgi:hypothetical protein
MKELIYRTLIERGYSEHNANLMLNDLENLSSPLDKLLQEWIDSENQQPDFVYENYSLHQFQNERKMEYPAALLTMDWLIKEPEKAKISLSRGIR